MPIKHEEAQDTSSSPPDEQVAKAAVSIQNVARQRQARQRVDRIRQERAIQNERALRIQASVRGRQARTRVTKIRKEKEEEISRRQRAATVIQGRGRDIVARNRVAAMRQMNAQKEEEIEHKSVGQEDTNTIEMHSIVESPSLVRRNSIGQASVVSLSESIDPNAPTLTVSASQGSPGRQRRHESEGEDDSQDP